VFSFANRKSTASPQLLFFVPNLPSQLGIRYKKKSNTFVLDFPLVVTSAGLAFALLTKLRFENSPNKKTLKQAWRFFY
jgi:hypothetical protein